MSCGVAVALGADELGWGCPDAIVGACEAGSRGSGVEAAGEEQAARTAPMASRRLKRWCRFMQPIRMANRPACIL
jgi:hypothetical protein